MVVFDLFHILDDVHVEDVEARAVAVLHFEGLSNQLATNLLAAFGGLGAEKKAERGRLRLRLGDVDSAADGEAAHVLAVFVACLCFSTGCTHQ